jgi:diketogulonate reductase-like aldo/keto reductase
LFVVAIVMVTLDLLGPCFLNHNYPKRLQFGRTPRQVALNFLTRHPNVFTIPKTTNPERVKENSGGVGWNLTAEEIERIDFAFPVQEYDMPLQMI